MKKFSALLMAVVLTGLWNFANASHVAGADLTYQCVGPNEFLVTLNLYRDCNGITLGSTETIDVSSPCGGDQSFTLNLDYFEEISQLCPNEIQNSTCSGGSLPGMEIHSYSGVITLNPECDFWTISWDLCCRNDLILNLVDPDLQDMYIEATINTEDFPCDNSPTFNNTHIPYVCLNSPVAYSYGVTEQDGDSLAYSLVGALEAGANQLAYVFPYNALDPIPGITIDPQTGLLQFTPTLVGTFVVVVQIEQWSDGQLIGTIMRDVQFVVIPCAGNLPPDPTTGTIDNFSGSGVQTGTYTIEMCETDNFCFDFTIVDPDVNDTLTLESTVLQTLPGATFTYSGTNPVSGTICWTAPPLSAAFYSFIISAYDNGCPVFATQTYGYSVEVLDRTNAGPDQTICGDQVAQLGASGGSMFNWTVLAGDPIQVGVNFSCDDCPNPIADPNNTTTYIVTSDLSGTCINADTVTVNVVPDFTFDIDQSSASACLGETIQFDVTVTPNAPGYIYEWTPSDFLSADDIPNPVGTYNQPGTYQYLVEITSPDNCVKLDTTITVTIWPAYIPDFSAFQLDTAVCEGESTQFFVELENTVPSQCGPNPAACGGTLTDITAGTGTQANTTTGYPSIYGNFYEGCKTQILFHADELYNLGFTGGTFVSLGFEVTAPVTGFQYYENWEIKMGCTTEEEMTTWISGLTTVFQADSIEPMMGMNVYNFTTNYNWDGISNIVVETCFSNPDWDDNLIQEHTMTPFTSSLWYRTDGNPNICSEVLITGTDMLRPNTFFTVCSGVDTTNIAFDWSPAGDFNDPTASNPVVTPQSSPTVYTLTVEDTVSGCNADTTFTVSWYPEADISFDANPISGVVPLNVQFDNTSATGTSNYFWDFGDSTNTSTDISPNFTYNQPGEYLVTLWGENQWGCGGFYQQLIIVLDEPIIDIPNVFSPNGDGSNDFFAFRDYRGFDSFNFMVFNRWGMEVHSTSSLGDDLAVWRPATDTPEGTYFYVFKGRGANGDEVLREGHITLVR